MNQNKMLVIGPNDPLSNGDMAIAICMVKKLKTLIPDAHLTMLSNLPELASKRYKPYFKSYDVNVEGIPWFKQTKHPLLTKLCAVNRTLSTLVNCFFWRCLRPLHINLPVRGDLQRYDIHIHCGADVHTEYYGMLALYYSLCPWIFSIITKKPFIICGETIGPFKDILTKFVVKSILNKASLIMVRDQISKDYLQAMGVRKSIHLTADPAFILDPVCAEEASKILANEGIANRTQLLVGITASSLIYRFAFPDAKNLKDKRKKYVMLMANIADYVAERFNATVLLIPHTMAAEDNLVHEQIYQKARDKTRVILTGRKYASDQFKGVIGKCHMFISCRMHAAIASTSMCIPTIAISYSHKFKGVLGPLLDTEKCVVNIMHSTQGELFSEICQKIDYVWENREQITRELKNNMPEMRERALLNVELIRELRDELSKSKKFDKRDKTAN